MKSFFSFMTVFVGLVGSCCGKSERVIIGKPIFQCGDNASIIETKSDFTKIRLPSNSHAFYSINTERATNCSNNHRCTLMTWKLIRDFELYLNSNFNFTGANGIIQFRVNKLIPGFNYLLHVILKNGGGGIEEKDFNISFFEGKNESKAIDIFGHLDLNIGTNRAYSTLPLVVNANATICGDLSYYYFIWTISTTDQQIKLPERSSELYISKASILTSNEEERCIISCQIVTSLGETRVAQGAVEVHIVDPPEGNSEIQVFLPFQSTTINKGAPISIVPYIYSSRNLHYKTQWVCFLEDVLLYGCQGQINTEFYMETGFSQEGNYSITLIVNTDKTEIAASCYVLILPDVPSIEFDIPYPIKPENGVEISAKISDLRTYCTVEWFSDEDNLNLKDVPGLTDTVYNISSKDKAFLEELVEFGSITVAKYFKLKLPRPSKTWAGLQSKHYRIQLSVTCPLIQEISDINTIKEHPENFVTVTAQTNLFIPPSPTVDSLEVEAEDNEALWTPYSYRVRNSLKENNSAVLYRYGFTLEGVDVVFYSGIDEFSAKTVLPYSGENDIETYVEICDFEGRCGRKYGPLVKTVLSHDLDEGAILRTFKQKLTEEDFYKVFSYAFIILHSSGLLNKSAEYNSIFSLEMLSKIYELREREDSKWAIERLIRGYVAFERHLEFSDDLKIQISELKHHYLSNSRNKREALSDSADLEKLEDLREHLTVLEHFILNSDNKAIAKGRDHVFELLDDWMTIACKMLFNGQRIPKVELETLALAIEKFPRKNLNTILTSPFHKAMWNSTIYLKINTNSTAQENYCLGHVMLKNFLDKSETYGVNIYSAETSYVDMNVSAEVTIYLPYREAFSEPLCMVYKEGRSSSCTSSKQYSSFVECVCPTFGYYFLDSAGNISAVDVEKLVSLNDTDNVNSTSDVYDYETARRIGRKISYVIILSSLVGFLILCYIIRKLTVFPQQNINMDGFSDTYAYGHAMDEDF